MFQIEIPGAWNLGNQSLLPKGVEVIWSPSDQARSLGLLEGRV
jgi:hypothetical protein